VSQGYPGSGTSDDPYIIQNLEIDVHNEEAIRIWNTDVSFVIRNCRILGGGVIFLNATRGSIESCELEHSYVLFDDSDNCTLVGSSIKYSGREGVVCYSSNNCVLSELVIEDCNVGIFLLASNDSRISENVVTDNRVGIDLYLCSNITLTENTLINNGVRLTLWWASLSGHILHGADFANISHRFDDNLVNGRLLGFFYNRSSMIIDASEYGQVILLNCRGVVLEHGVFSNSTTGLQVLHSENCVVRDIVAQHQQMRGFDILFSNNTVVENCRIEYNDESGIFVEMSNYTSVVDNKISGNTEGGTHFHISSKGTIVNNSIINNDVGISFYDSTNFSVMGNTILENTVFGILLSGQSNYNRFYANSFGSSGRSHVKYDWGSSCYNNFWDDGVSQGNLWDDYIGFGHYEVCFPDVDRFPSGIGTVQSGFTVIASVTLIIIALAGVIMVLYRRIRAA
jgi:parallel beta-helix repeat protein